MAEVTSLHLTGTGDTIKILPMTDHYAVTANGETVAVVCKTLDGTLWGVWVIVGRVSEPSQYVQLDMALKAAMTWRR